MSSDERVVRLGVNFQTLTVGKDASSGPRAVLEMSERDVRVLLSEAIFGCEVIRNSGDLRQRFGVEKQPDAGGVEGLTLYHLRLSVFGPFQLYEDEAMALFQSLGAALSSRGGGR